MLTRMRGYL